MRIKPDIPFCLSEIANICGGVFYGADATVNSISTDSRECEKNDLFIALMGENFDGAEFSQDAKRRGAFVLSDKNNIGADILVADAEKSLLSIATEYKKRVSPKYTVAITGSIGKTTTKDFTYALLSKSFNTHKTLENFNNIIGLSYTLLSMKKGTDALICELGMNHTGEIDILSRALAPDISVITNIGSAHIGNLGTRENIAAAKLEIQNGMHGGKTIIPKSEPLLNRTKNPYFISYSDKSADMFIRITKKDTDKIQFTAKTKSFEIPLVTSLYSEHHLNSLIYAIGVYDILGCSPQMLQSALDLITPNLLRQKFIRKNGYIFYNDSYNSSPEAVIENMRMLSGMNKYNSAILGDMLELGEMSEKMHETIGAECARNGFKKIYTFGRYSKIIATGAINSGMAAENVFINEDVFGYNITAESIRNSYNGETVLVKGSHALGLEKIIEILTETKGEKNVR